MESLRKCKAKECKSVRPNILTNLNTGETVVSCPNVRSLVYRDELSYCPRTEIYNSVQGAVDAWNRGDVISGFKIRENLA